MRHKPEDCMTSHSPIPNVIGAWRKPHPRQPHGSYRVTATAGAAPRPTQPLL